jgi:hypothetical protein
MRRLSKKDLSFLFIVLCALTLAVTSIETLALTNPVAGREEAELGFLPQAGTLFILENSFKNEPLPLRPVLVMAGMVVCAILATHGHCIGYFPAPTSLPTDYRLFFLLPVFNSKFKD